MVGILASAGAPHDALDFGDPAVLADPYPAYAWLRAEPSIVRSDDLGWLVARHADVSALLHDRRLASAPLNQALYATLPPEALTAIEPFQQSMANNMLFQDAPDHARLRRLVSQAFTPRRIQALRETIQKITDELLSGRHVGDRFDVIGDLAFPLPSRVIAEMLGVPWDDLAQLKEWGDNGVAFLGTARTTTDPIGQARRTGASSAAMQEYFRALVERHRASPADDLICAMIAVEEEGDQLSELELLATCGLLFTAGHETTTNAIGNGLLALMTHPEQRQLWHDEPSLAPAAVDELIRFDSPVQLLYRVALEAVKVGEVTIQAGDFVTLLLGAANRDDAAFLDPDRLDLRRRPRHSLSFGTGPHACLGVFLARLEAEVALTTLLGRFPGLTPTEEPLVWHPNPIFRGVKRLPVLL